jgi:uncharacterized damage-inducible protein DinB
MFTAEQAKGMAMMTLEGLEKEAATTRKVIAAIPEDKINFKLGEKGWTAGKIAWHLVKSEAWFADGIANLQFGSEEEGEPAATVADILKYYDQMLPGALAKLRAMSGEQFATPVNFYNIMNMPAAMYLHFWNNHSVHHRGYLAAYLRAMNAHVPSIYGGSADEPFQMPATA